MHILATRYAELLLWSFSKRHLLFKREILISETSAKSRLKRDQKLFYKSQHYFNFPLEDGENKKMTHSKKNLLPPSRIARLMRKVIQFSNQKIKEN